MHVVLSLLNLFLFYGKYKEGKLQAHCNHASKILVQMLKVDELVMQGCQGVGRVAD